MKSKSKKLSPNRISHKRRFLRCFLLTTIVAILLTMTVLADDADTINIIKEFDMPQNNVVSYVCRWIGWALLCGLSYLVNGIESVIYNVNSTIGNFFANAKIQNLNNTLLVILFLVLLLVVLFVGFQFIIQPQQQIAPIITNAIIGLVVLVTVPYMISSLYSVTNAAIGIIGQGQQTGMGTQILLDNVTDVLRYDTDNFSTTNLGDRKSWYAENSSDRITDIDITEMVKPEDTTNSEVFGHKVGINSNGTEVLTDISTTSFMWQDIPLLSERYYRWKVDWLVCFVSLIISAIALFLSSIRMAVALYELAIHGMMTEVMALLDVYTHQRMKKCLQLLVTTFASFFGFFLLMQVYLIGMNAISSSSANLFVKIVCMFALGWMVIDGPSIFEKVIGQDLGIRNAARTLMGLRAAGAIVGKGGNLASRGKNLLVGRRTFGGGREGGLRGRVVGDKSRDASGQVTHTGGLVNRVHPSQGTNGRRNRKNQQPSRASYQTASASAGGTGGAGISQDKAAAPMSVEENGTDTTASTPHTPKYRPNTSPYAPKGYRQQAASQATGRNAFRPGSPFVSVAAGTSGASSYSPSGRRTGASTSSKVVRDALFPDSGMQSSGKQEKKPSSSGSAVYDDLFPGSVPSSQAASQPLAGAPHQQKLKSSGGANVVRDNLTPGGAPASEKAAPQPMADAPHEPKLAPSGGAGVVQDNLTPGGAPASEKAAPQPMADAPHEPKLAPSGGEIDSGGTVRPMADAPHEPKLAPSGSEIDSGGTVQPTAVPQGPVPQPSATTGQPHVPKLQSAAPVASPPSGVILGNLPSTKAPSSFSGAAIPRYRAGGRASSVAGSYTPIHTPKYQPSYPSSTGGQPVSSSGSGSSYRPTYNAPHMPKYRPSSSVSSGGSSYQPISSPSTVSQVSQGSASYQPVSSTSYVPKVQQQTVSPVSTSVSYSPVPNTTYEPKIQQQAAPPVQIDNLWTEPPAPKITQSVEVPPTINVPAVSHPPVSPPKPSPKSSPKPSQKPNRNNKTNPKE